MAASRTAQVTLHTVTNYVLMAVQMAVFFFLTPFIIGKVGAADFGLWSLSYSVLGFFALMELGFGTGAVKYTAECRGSGDIDRRNRMVSTLALVYVLLALAALVGILVISLGFNAWFRIPGPQHEKALAVLWILAARTVLLALPLGLFRSVLYGEQRISLLNMINIVSTLFYGATAWMALSGGLGLVALALVNLAAMLVEHLAYVFFAFSRIKGLRVSFALADLKLFKEVAAFSIFSFTANAAGFILFRADPIIIKCYMPLAAVAVYAVALKISEQALSVTKLFVNVLVPIVAEFRGSGEEGKIRFILVHGTRYALVPATILSVILVTYSREIILFWVGPAMAAAAPVLVVLACAMFLTVMQMTAAGVLTMTGREKFTAKAFAISMVINLSVSIALVGPYGLLGIAGGTLAASLLVDVLMIVRKGCDAYGVGYGAFARLAVAPALFPGVLQWALTYGLKTWMPPHGLIAVGLQAIPGALLYAVLFWFFGLEATEKRRFIGLVARIRPAAP